MKNFVGASDQLETGSTKVVVTFRSNLTIPLLVLGNYSIISNIENELKCYGGM